MSTKYCTFLVTDELENLEWGEEEWVASVFGSEDAEKEAVDSEEHHTPNDNGHLLGLVVRHTGNLQCECDGCK